MKHAVKKELLFLAHRIPFPPNKGDKIRSFNLLRHLARDWTVHLGAFVDDPDDWRHEGEVAALSGGEIHLLGLPSRRAKLKSLRGLLTGDPLTLPFYFDARMQTWVDDLLQRRPIGHAVAFSSAMAQYLERHRELQRVVDVVDVDSDKWAQYAESKAWPMSTLYRRESRTLLGYERHIAASFDASVFVSEDEAELFRRLAPESTQRVHAVRNGVDTDYFSPRGEYADPYAGRGPVMVFTGAMDYWANVDAVRWFADEILPSIRRQIPAAEFFVVGARPTPEVLALGEREGISVTGAVEDIRPYVAHARVAMVPMRIARGVQNKVLEAMAMARPVVLSPEAAEGIDAADGKHFRVGRDAAALQAATLNCLQEDCSAMGHAARELVLREYAWKPSLHGFDRLLEARHGQ